MKLAIVIAIIVVLALIAAAVAHFALRPRGPRLCPPIPPGVPAVGFWSTPDNSTARTIVSCPGATTIAVQAAGYGAPWGQCPWVDVTREARRILDGRNSIVVPMGPGGPLGLPDPCVGKVKTFVGAFACAGPRP
jgi:hypothetical protein